MVGATVVTDELEPRVLAEVARPRAGHRARPRRRAARGSKEHWGWNWSETRKVLDYLFLVGDVAIAGRNSQFEVLYDLPERVLPPPCSTRPTPTRAGRRHRAGPPRRALPRRRDGACLRRLLPDAPAPGHDSRRCGRHRRAGRGGGADPGARSRAGSDRPTCTATRGCRAGSAPAPLLSPFDPVVWERERTEALFDFHYRIEIYVPAEKRRPRLLRAAVPARRPAGRPGSTSRPTGAAGRSWSGAYAEAGAPGGDGRRSWPPSCAGWPAGSGWTTRGRPRGDLAPALAVEVASAADR